MTVKVKRQPPPEPEREDTVVLTCQQCGKRFRRRRRPGRPPSKCRTCREAPKDAAPKKDSEDEDVLGGITIRKVNPRGKPLWVFTYPGDRRPTWCDSLAEARTELKKRLRKRS